MHSLRAKTDSMTVGNGFIRSVKVEARFMMVFRSDYDG